jgi:Bacterial protein of unknown function (DUF937)
MTSLLGSFTQLMTPDSIGKISRVAGVDANQAQKGLDVIGPLLLGSLARKSETVSGMDSIMRLLPEDTGTGLLGKVVSMAGSPGPIAASSLLTGVLGPGVNTIGKALGGRLGFDATPLLSLAAPAILGVISSTAKEHKLNSADIAKTLQQEATATMAAARPEVQAVLTEAFRLGDKAEELRKRFTDEEWKSIRLAPIAATFYVISASPSGVAGLSKEVIAGGDALKELVKSAMPTSLVDVAFGSYEPKLEWEGLDDKNARIKMLDVLRDASAAVKGKTPVDAQSFSDALVTVSRKVAEASKEGGFLGIGGTRVSQQEEHAIAEIGATLA